MITREKRLAALRQVSREFNKLIEEADEALVVLQHELEGIHISWDIELSNKARFGLGKSETKSVGRVWELYIDEYAKTNAQITDASPLSRVLAAQKIDELLDGIIARQERYLKEVQEVATKAKGEEPTS